MKMTEQSIPKYKIGDYLWHLSTDPEQIDLEYIKIEGIIIGLRGVAYGYEDYTIDEEYLFTSDTIHEELSSRMEEMAEKCQMLDAQLASEKSLKTKLEAEARAQGKSE